MVNVSPQQGTTPLIELSNYAPQGWRVFAKLECCGPTGSAKDRSAVSMVADAVASGRLQRGMTVVEASSGNASVAIASAAARAGCRMMALVPPNLSGEKIARQSMYGVEARETIAEDGSSSSDYRRDIARQMADEQPDRFLTLDQFANPSNPDGHERTTGAEIVSQIRSLRPPTRHVDYFIAGAGTGGTLTGVARAIRGASDIAMDTRVVMADPTGSVLASHVNGIAPQAGGMEAPDGLGAAFLPPNLDVSIIDEAYSVTRTEALREIARLRHCEGIFAGPCTGYSLAVLNKLAERDRGEPRVAVVIVTDRGELYLSDPKVREAVA